MLRQLNLIFWHLFSQFLTEWQTLFLAVFDYMYWCFPVMLMEVFQKFFEASSERFFELFFVASQINSETFFSHVFGNKSRHFWLDSETFSSRFIFVPLLSFFSHKHISALLSISAGSRSLNGGRLSLHDAAWRRSVPQTSSPFHFLFHIQPEWSKSFFILKWVSSLFTVCFVQTVKLRNFRPHWKTYKVT